MIANAFTAFFMLHRMNQPVMKGRCWHFMKEKRSFWIVGGDLRQIKLAELLLEDGHQVQTYAVEQRPDQGKLPGTDTLRGIEEADCVILPLPVMAEHGILNSKLSDRRVEKVEDVVNIGDMTWVKVTEIDEKGRVNLSRKDALKELAAQDK